MIERSCCVVNLLCDFGVFVPCAPPLFPALYVFFAYSPITGGLVVRLRPHVVGGTKRVRPVRSDGETVPPLQNTEGRTDTLLRVKEPRHSEKKTVT